MSESNLIDFPNGNNDPNTEIEGHSPVPPQTLDPLELLETQRLQLISKIQYIEPLATDEYFASKLGFITKPSSVVDPLTNKPKEIPITPKEALDTFKAMMEENLKALKRLKDTGLIVP